MRGGGGEPFVAALGDQDIRPHTSVFSQTTSSIDASQYSHVRLKANVPAPRCLASHSDVVRHFQTSRRRDRYARAAGMGAALFQSGAKIQSRGGPDSR